MEVLAASLPDEPMCPSFMFGDRVPQPEKRPGYSPVVGPVNISAAYFIESADSSIESVKPPIEVGTTDAGGTLTPLQ